jgi:GNAT superfamily N-acetyltransferase
VQSQSMATAPGRPALAPLPHGFTLGPMSEAETATLATWAAAEGWNPGPFDLATAWRVESQAFIALRHHGVLAGGGCGLSYGGRFGFMGLFIVDRPWRSQGLGARLWHHRLHHLLARLQPDAAIGMDGVIDMVPFYRRGGFEPAYRHVRYQGVARPSLGAAAEPLSHVSFDRIQAFDDRYSPAPRHSFLRAWLAQPGIRALVVRSGDEVLGYGVMRPCLKGFKLGPLLAVDADVASTLVNQLLSMVPGEQVQWDVPEANAAAVQLARAKGLVPSFACMRMYRGAQPRVPLDAVFGATSLEFG